MKQALFCVNIFFFSFSFLYLLNPTMTMINVYKQIILHWIPILYNYIIYNLEQIEIFKLSFGQLLHGDVFLAVLAPFMPMTF